MVISGLIPLLQQPGLMLEMEEQRQKLLDFFTDALPKLADAELCAQGDPNVRTWLVDFNAVAYDADDIVHDFRYAKLQPEGCQNRNGERVRAGLFLFSCFKFSRINRSGVLKGIENRIGPVVKKIEDLVERMRVLNFRPGQETKIITSAEMPQHMIFSTLEEIVGRDKEKENIVKLICSPNPDVQIMGPKGIGKTAFVPSVCNDARIKNQFKYVLWVEVGPEFNSGKVIKCIIDQALGKDCCISEDNAALLHNRIFQELRGNYLLVLDNVSSVYKEPLNEFISWMVMERYNCVITTSNYTIHLNRMSSYKLEPLMVDDGWNVFCEKAFSDDDPETCQEILGEMGKEFVVRCGGSPLALNMMGGLMRFKKGPEEWQGVINQLRKETLNDIGAATVETIIKVCYDNLCSQVKQCFAFCSLFPKGHYMDKEVIVKLWIANGLLLYSDGSRSMPPEEKGNIVFNELTSRHFFEDVKLVHEHLYGNKHGYHGRVTCKLLDLIHEQAVIAAREFALKSLSCYLLLVIHV